METSKIKSLKSTLEKAPRFHPPRGYLFEDFGAELKSDSSSVDKLFLSDRHVCNV